jgi:DNA-directed RNA polymerase subunit P
VPGRYDTQKYRGSNRVRDLSGDKTQSQEPQPQPQQPEKVFAAAVYECVRCGTRTTQEELSKLPEVKCICGYRVFKKARPGVVKQIKAV